MLTHVGVTRSGLAIVLQDYERKPECVLCHLPFVGTKTQKMCNPCRESPEGQAHQRHMRNRSQQKKRRRAAARG